MIYWIAPAADHREEPPANFIREAPEIAGIHSRMTTGAGTLSIYATGRQSACDTRLSAIVSGPGGRRDADGALAGVFVEYIKNGVSYFMGDMKPRIRISRAPEQGTAQMTVTQNRHSMGREAKPLMFGNFMGNIKTWTHDCWRGGSPLVNPVTTTETWRWEGDGRLHGAISVTALRDAPFDEIRITLPFLGKRIDESTSAPGLAAARSGHLCVEITGAAGQWETPPSPP
ncbi:MAG: hypothetical protein LBK99_24425, partial [Opitutaceae bacterium]|nr:hypothetical protein [Opitutaceae bacterium]